MKLCADCTMVAANGPNSIDVSQERMDEILSKVEGPVVLGNDYEDFSTSPCDGCGSRLAGYRHEADTLN